MTWRLLTEAGPGQRRFGCAFGVSVPPPEQPRAEMGTRPAETA